MLMLIMLLYVLVDRLSPYSFNLYYIKRKDMILADYLSRHFFSDGHTTDLIPISFCCFSLYLHHKGFESYHIIRRSQATAAGEVAPKVHGTDRTLDPHEHQSKSVIQTAPTPAPKGSNVQSLAKKPIFKSIQKLVKKISQPSSLDSDVIPLPPQSFLPPVPLKHTWQVTHKVPLPPSSPIQGEDSGNPSPIGKYSSKICHMDPIPNLGTDTGSSEEILDPEYEIPTDS